MQIKLWDKGSVVVDLEIGSLDSVTVSSTIGLDGKALYLHVNGEDIPLGADSSFRPLVMRLFAGEPAKPEPAGIDEPLGIEFPTPIPASIPFGGPGMLYDEALDHLLELRHPNQGLDDIRNPPVGSTYTFRHSRGGIHVVFRELAYEWCHRKYMTLNQIHDLFMDKVHETDPGCKGRRAMFQHYGFGKTVDLSDRVVQLPLRDAYELAKCANCSAGWSFNRQLLPGDFGTPLVCFYNTAYRKQDLVGVIVHYRHRACSTAEPTEATKSGMKRPPIWYLYSGRMGEGAAKLAGSKDRPVCGTLNEVLRRANSYLRKIAQSVQDHSRSRRRIPEGQQPLPGIDAPARKKK